MDKIVNVFCLIKSTPDKTVYITHSNVWYTNKENDQKKSFIIHFIFIICFCYWPFCLFFVFFLFFLILFFKLTTLAGIHVKVFGFYLPQRIHVLLSNLVLVKRITKKEKLQNKYLTRKYKLIEIVFYSGKILVDNTMHFRMVERLCKISSVLVDWILHQRKKMHQMC